MSEAIIRAGAEAFGDGSHPSTLCVLAALESMDPQTFQPRRACDMGAGSGILSLAMAAQFNCPVWAVEKDKQAIEVLQENMQRNGAGVTVLHAQGFDHPALQQAAPFDLIVMNILAEPLLALAEGAETALAEEGVLLLGGLLQWQEPQIRAAYTALGLELASRLTLKEWVMLAFQKPSHNLHIQNSESI